MPALIHWGYYKEEKMSDTLLCNYCCYQDIERRAKKDGLLVIKERDRCGWICIYTKKAGDKPPGKFLVSFMELTEKCAC